MSSEGRAKGLSVSSEGLAMGRLVSSGRQRSRIQQEGASDVENSGREMSLVSYEWRPLAPRVVKSQPGQIPPATGQIARAAAPHACSLVTALG